MKENKNIQNNSEENERQISDFWKHFLAGGIAGMISRTVTAPLDRIKTFRQISTTEHSFSQLVHSMLKEGGVSSLWRGNLLNVLKNAPKQAIKFAVYDETKRFLLQNSKDKQLSSIQRFYAGCIAGTLSHVVVYPLEMLKIRLTIRTTGQYKNIMDAIIKIYKVEGLRTFGRGFAPSVVSVIPYSGIDLAGYEMLKSIVFLKYQRSPNSSEQFIIGSISSFIAHFVVYPLVLICVRMQADDRDLKKYKLSMNKMLIEIWEKERFAGLYRGMYFNLFKFIPMTGLQYVIYEQVNNYLGIKMT